jgi:hypothetical protein
VARNGVEDLDQLIVGPLIEPAHRHRHARREIALEGKLQMTSLFSGKSAIASERRERALRREPHASDRWRKFLSARHERAL